MVRDCDCAQTGTKRNIFLADLPMAAEFEASIEPPKWQTPIARAKFNVPARRIHNDGINHRAGLPETLYAAGA